MISSPLPNYVRANRKRLALSQDDVAFLLGAESGTKVSRYENFVRVPSLETALAYATVTLWSPQSTSLYATTTRKGEYFRGELLLNNSTGAVWMTITNLAVLNDGSSPDIERTKRRFGGNGFGEHLPTTSANFPSTKLFAQLFVEAGHDRSG